jgi:hypothetical protein
MIRKLGVANLVLLSIALAFAVVNVPTSGIAQTDAGRKVQHAGALRSRSPTVSILWR